MVRRAVKSMVDRSLGALGYRIERIPAERHPVFSSDGLTVRGKKAPFVHDQRFMSAYRRGINSGHVLGGAPNVDFHVEWRAAVACWAAQHGAKLPGDFVECGVNTGIFSLAVCEYVDLNSLDKSFYLFDTFNGIPVVQMSAQERAARSDFNTQVYPECYELACRNFAEFKRAVLVRGTVPETLASVVIEKVAYLSIDMNIAYPERKAIEHFWPKLSSGAFVLLDDYGWQGYEEQMESMDDFARSQQVEILALPTGQGLLIKP
jgi:O-methyltransferase